MKLSAHQARFAEQFSVLCLVLAQMRDDQGRRMYRHRKGDAFRDPRAFGEWGVVKAYGRGRSQHKKRLAEDIILDVRGEDGRWEYARLSDQYKPLGELWEALDPLNRWGGRYGDGNHFERMETPWTP